ncbi:MAG: metallopeptidase family protein [Hyphomicrobium denitrificans]|nr:metallopeptidase family protein [Hyphomicrobium denitrificans]
MSVQWASAKAPTLAEFEALAMDAWENLPPEFRDIAGDLAGLGIEDPFELTGLYQGVSLTKQSVMESAREPDMVFLYRRAILDEWSENGEELGHLIGHVLIHEIGHHFGFSDEDMEHIEAGAAS